MQSLQWWKIILVALLFQGICFANVLKEPDFTGIERKLHEADYVDLTCIGQIEFELKDKTRVDCLTDKYAIEYDWAKKWAESIGQSLYYAKMTGKKPAVAIIVKKPTDDIYISRIKKIKKGITIFKIKAIDYVEPTIE